MHNSFLKTLHYYQDNIFHCIKPYIFTEIDLLSSTSSPILSLIKQKKKENQITWHERNLKQK